MKKILLLFIIIMSSNCTKAIPEVCAYCENLTTPSRPILMFCGYEPEVKLEIMNYEKTYSFVMKCKFEKL